jgi:ABC-2 type transport system ATP-binding protein
MILETNNLSKKYKKDYVLKDVSLHLEKGDIYGFVGENGAGKTTLIRLVTGLVLPTSGSFQLFGFDSKDRELEKAKRSLGAIVESPSLNLSLRAYENLKIQCILLNLPFDRIKLALEKVGLESGIDNPKPVKNYSLGMRQRLGIAVALLGEPTLLLLDEPLNGLDPKGIVEMRELILSLHAQGVTILLSSHILSELEKIATKYGFIHKGHLLKEVTKEEIIKESRKYLEVEIVKKKITDENLFIHEFNQIEFTTPTHFRIYDNINLLDAIHRLSNYEIEVRGIFFHEETIEEYYMNLMGGKKE